MQAMFDLTKKPFILIFLLSGLAGLLSLLPILIGGKEGIFYSIDPESMYVGNALSYIKAHQIDYVDHPGTPTILTLATALAPWRAYAKLIIHEPFILWSLTHLDLIFGYLRLWQVMILMGAIFVFLSAIYVLTSSRLSVLGAWLAILIFSPTLWLGPSIGPETETLLIGSFWLLILAKFLKKPRMDLMVVLGLVAGLAVANKFTALFLIVSSVLLPLTLRRLLWYQKLANMGIVGLIAGMGFMIGTWPIKRNYNLLWKWLLKLISSTGIHGSGKKAIFDFSSYKESVLALYHQEPAIVVLIGLFLLILIYWGVVDRNKRLFLRLMLLGGVFIVGVLVFAKYPLTYYQLTNFAVLVFLITALLNKFNKIYLVLLILILLPTFKTKVNKYLINQSTAIAKTVTLENFVTSHPAKKATLWEWGRTEDFARLWITSRSWHGDLFTIEREKMELAMDELDLSKLENVFELCWDQIYIQQVSAVRFLAKYPLAQKDYKPIGDSGGMALIESDHCLQEF